MNGRFSDAASTSSSSGTSGKRHRLPWLNGYGRGWVLHHCIMVLIIIPGLAAAGGAIIEHFLYAPGSRPSFHVKWMPLGALIGAPFILLRVFWRWPRYLIYVEMFIYVLQTIGYFVAVNRTVIVGGDFYTVNSGIRDVFQEDTSAPGVNIFRRISTPDHTWTWLRHVVSTVYSSDTARGLVSRPMPPTRLALLTSLKLRQYRVMPVCCSEFMQVLFPSVADVCYPMFSERYESREDYGENLTFSYSDRPSIATTGYLMNLRSQSLSGKFSDYPLAGFSTYFAPGIRRDTALRHLDAMRRSAWIDEQTRAVVVELALTSIDFIDSPVWAAATFLVERDVMGRFTASQPKVYLNHFDHAQNDQSLTGGGSLSGCPNASQSARAIDLTSPEQIQRAMNGNGTCPRSEPGQYIKVFYQSVFAIMVYTTFLAVRGLCNDWKEHVKRPFNWMAALWGVLLCVTWAYQLLAFDLLECTFNAARQPPFAGLEENSAEGLLSTLAPKSEFLPFAFVETQSRRFLAISIFIHVFSSLRFLVRLKSLGIMVRTLWFSAPSLFSFSISFLVIFSGFVLMFYYIFSVDARSFHDIPNTITTLWLGMIGELEVTDELFRARDWTIGLYIVFTFLSAFVLLTLIISIVSNAHEKAQRESSHVCVNASTEDLLAEPRTGRRATIINADPTELVAESDVLTSVVERWKHVSTLRSRSRRVKPTTASDQQSLTNADAMDAQSAVELAPQGTSSNASGHAVASVRHARGPADDDTSMQERDSQV